MTEMDRSDTTLLANLKRDGFSLHRRLDPHLSTGLVAQALGKIINLEAVIPLSKIPSIQSLRPREASEVGQNQYSGHYGLGAFPLHSDLAHWAIPPRYLLLRCAVGSNDVFTHILPWKPIVEVLGQDVLRKAVLTARTRRIGCSSLVRALSNHLQTEVLRWDPIFLRPLNQHARSLASVMFDPAWSRAAVMILLSQPGDTLVVDNWRILHGRSAVPAHSRSRHVDRVYLSEVFD
jgi:L-asparagine oxygenase